MRRVGLAPGGAISPPCGRTSATGAFGSDASRRRPTARSAAASARVRADARPEASLAEPMDGEDGGAGEAVGGAFISRRLLRRRSDAQPGARSVGPRELLVASGAGRQRAPWGDAPPGAAPAHASASLRTTPPRASP